MNRCFNLAHAGRPLLLRCLLALALLAWALVSPAQSTLRNIPANAVRGVMVVQQPPAITMDGKPDRLSPGARIHDANNMLVLSGALTGQSLVVSYVRENTGLVHEVWILTPDESLQKHITRTATPQ